MSEGPEAINPLACSECQETRVAAKERMSRVQVNRCLVMEGLKCFFKSLGAAKLGRASL